jgi:phospholipase C
MYVLQNYDSGVGYYDQYQAVTPYTISTSDTYLRTETINRDMY